MRGCPGTASCLSSWPSTSRQQGRTSGGPCVPGTEHQRPPGGQVSTTRAILCSRKGRSWRGMSHAVLREAGGSQREGKGNRCSGASSVPGPRAQLFGNLWLWAPSPVLSPGPGKLVDSLPRGELQPSARETDDERQTLRPGVLGGQIGGDWRGQRPPHPVSEHSWQPQPQAAVPTGSSVCQRSRRNLRTWAR